MKNSIRRVCALLAVLCLLCAAGFALAENNTTLIRDDAELFTDEQEKLLAEGMDLIGGYGKPMLWTTREIGSVSAIAERFYRENAGGDSGVLFVIDMREREIYIFSDGDAYKSVSRSAARVITDNVYRYASHGDYYSCAAEAFSQIRAKLDGARIAEPMRLVTCGLLALALALLVVYGACVSAYTGSIPMRKGKVIGVLPLSAGKNERTLRMRYDLVDKKILSRRVVKHESSGGGSYSGGSRSGGGSFRSGGGGGFRSGGGGGHRF